MFPKPQARLVPLTAAWRPWGSFSPITLPATPLPSTSELRHPGIQPPPQFSFPGPPSPQLPARSQSVRVPKKFRNLCLVISEKGHQGPERGRDLPEVTQQIRILSQGAVPSSFNRRDPPLPYLGLGWGDPRAPEGGTRYGLGACLPAFPTGVLLWAPPPQLWARIQRRRRRQQGWELGRPQEIPFRSADPNRPGGLR